MTSHTIFIQLAVILGMAAILGYFMRLLKLPLIVAYLLVGVLIASMNIFDVHTSEVLTFLPEIGMAFVLFFVGMELDIKEIKHLGKPIIVAGLGQIIISTMAGSIIASVLGFPLLESFYLGTALGFSSTIVVVKLLLEKKDFGSLYGKLSLGILLLEDLVAVILLMGMTVSSSFLNLGFQSSLPLITLFIKGAFLLLLSLVFARYILERVFDAVAKSAELLFLSALAWCFIFVSVSLFLGFSVVIGAFLAGIALANSPFHFEIQGKVKPLRDFFVTLFFVYLGSQVVFSQITEVLPLIAIFTFYAILIKPMIYLLLLGIFGFKKHTIFQSALNLSQISEFSLIVMVVGLNLGVVSQSALTAMALTGVISIIFSSIMITYSRSIYKIVVPFIGFFEHGGVSKSVDGRPVEMEDHVILVGARWMGGEIIRFLKREGIPFMVIDFDPEVVKKLACERVHVLFGDISDPEILEFLDLKKAKLVISTADSHEDNLILAAELRRKNPQAALVIRASDASEAEGLYLAGVDYAILPDVVSGDFVTQILKNHWPNMDFFKDRSKKELEKLSHKHLNFN